MASNDSFIEKFILAFSVRAILFKFTIGFIFVLVFNIEGLRIHGDEVFKNSVDGFFRTLFSFDMLVALFSTYREAVVKALASLYPIIQSLISGNIEILTNGSYITIGLALGIFIALIFQYQSFVALFLNIGFPDLSNLVMFFFSLSVTGALIVIASVFATIVLGVQPTLFTDLIGNHSSNIVNNISNNTTTSGGFVIDLT